MDTRGDHNSAAIVTGNHQNSGEEYEFDPSSLVEDYVASDASSTQMTCDDGESSGSSLAATEKETKRMLNIQNKRFNMLVESMKTKDERLEKLEMELNHQKMQHKEGIYWLQLQLDTAQREKYAAEERMAELQAGIQDMIKMDVASRRMAPEGTTTTGSRDFQSKLQKYESSLRVMENQITMVKTSCGEVIKTLKEEIADFMENRSRVEVDLLNQISNLEILRKRSELEYELRLNEKDEMIERLQTKDHRRESTSLNGLKKQITELRNLKQKAEERSAKERSEADEVIHWLKEDKSRLERELEESAGDLAILRSETGSTKASELLDRVAHERDVIASSLSRVTTVWELADASIVNLQDDIDQLRPPDNTTELASDREKMLSTLQSASLLHGQIKLSLLLIEFKLRNQLDCLKNDKLAMGSSRTIDEEFTRTMEELQKDALAALSEVESTLSSHLNELKETALAEVASTKVELRDRVKKFEELQVEYRRLESELSQLKENNQGSECIGATEWHPDGNQTIAISTPVMQQLHTEIIRIIDRIKEKNAMIASLKDELENHKTREENLRKELKRSLRANHASQNATRAASHSPSLKTKTKKIGSAGIKRLPSSPLMQSPTGSSIRTPVKERDVLSVRFGTGQSPIPGSSMLYSPNSSIKPLQPSPREISRPRHSSASPPWVPSSTFFINVE